MNTDKPILLNRCSSVFICVHLWPLLFLVFFGKLKRAYLLLKAEAGAAQVDLVAGAQLLAAAVAGGDVDRAAIAEDAGAEFAPVIRDAVFARRKLDVRVLARHGVVGLVGAFEKDHVVATYHARFGIGQLRQAADVGARFRERVSFALRLTLHHYQACRRGRSGCRGAIPNLEGAASGFGGFDIDRKGTWQLAAGAFQSLAHVVREAALGASEARPGAGGGPPAAPNAPPNRRAGGGGGKKKGGAPGGGGKPGWPGP